MDNYSCLSGKEFDDAVLSITHLINDVLNCQNSSARTAIEASEPFGLLKRLGPPAFNVEGIPVNMTGGGQTLLSEQGGKIAVIRTVRTDRRGRIQVQRYSVEQYVSWLTSDARVTKKEARKAIEDAQRKLKRRLPVSYHSHIH